VRGIVRHRAPSGGNSARRRLRPVPAPFSKAPASDVGQPALSNIRDHPKAERKGLKKRQEKQDSG